MKYFLFNEQYNCAPSGGEKTAGHWLTGEVTSMVSLHSDEGCCCCCCRELAQATEAGWLIKKPKATSLRSAPVQQVAREGSLVHLRQLLRRYMVDKVLRSSLFG